MCPTNWLMLLTTTSIMLFLNKSLNHFEKKKKW
uniref:ATP synthase F0 subunit 8 n=1 Tax=Metanigrus guttatus TaxID=3038047 RepID=A0AB38XYG8_9HEMI